LEWHHKLKRKMVLITLSNIFIEHPFTYEIGGQDNVVHFIISKLKIIQLQVTKQSNQKSVCICDIILVFTWINEYNILYKYFRKYYKMNIWKL